MDDVDCGGCGRVVGGGEGVSWTWLYRWVRMGADGPGPVGTARGEREGLFG